MGSMYSFRYGGLSSENGYPLFYGKDGKLWHEADPKRMELVKSGSILPGSFWRIRYSVDF